jgi:hypothetical protein
LDVSYNEIDKAGGTLLAEIISSRNVGLRKLSVRNCSITKANTIAIANALLQNSSIRDFDFSGNQIKDVYFILIIIMMMIIIMIIIIMHSISLRKKAISWKF